MRILFYCPWYNSDEWLKEIKKQFKDCKIYTLQDNPDLSSIDCAIIWDLNNFILKKLTNLKVIFSLGAGVDHILKLKDYKKQPIIRIKDSLMAERMHNHLLSQILNYQLNLKFYQKSQKNKTWIDNLEPDLNNNVTIGILGLGFLGSFVAKKLKNLNYKIIGFKKFKTKKKYNFPIFFQTKYIKKFLIQSNIVVSILPDTPTTYHFINSAFLRKMKKKALLINVGRGSTLDEKALITHLKNHNHFFVSLDVFEKEPLPKTSPLWNLPNVTITPHVASLTVVKTSVNYLYSKYKFFKKNKKINSDVDIRKGY